MGPSALHPRIVTAALVGTAAASVALAVGELVSAADPAGTSLVSVVGDELIDLLAGSLKDLAVELFGTNDKAALVVGIVVTALALGALLGVAARRRPLLVGSLGFGAFGAIGGLAYQRSSLTSAGVGWAAAACATTAGVVALLVLHAFGLRPTSGARAAVVDGVAGPDEGGAAVRPAPVAPDGTVGPPDRRRFLVGAGALGVAAAGGGVLSRRLRGADPVARARAKLVLPGPTSPAGPLPDQPFAVPGLTPYVTPTPDFYRIDTALTVPRVDPERWELRVGGLVERPFSLRFDDLLALDSVEVPVTLQCVSNEVGGDLVGTAVWQGVPLAALLEQARPTRDAEQVVGRSVDGWTAGFPLEAARDGRTALVAYAMNGEPLPARHGFPARLVVAGLYGYVSATKWLEEIELAPWEDVDGYWVPRGWSKEGPIKLASRIDVPRGGAELAPGPVPVAGVAWAPTRGVARVDLRVDDGPWEPCDLGRVVSDETWVQWHRIWEATPGEHVLRVRAVAADGEVQTAEVRSPAPDGATGHHARRVRVAHS